LTGSACAIAFPVKSSVRAKNIIFFISKYGQKGEFAIPKLVKIRQVLLIAVK
jgi:hypothetical protein